MNKIKIIFLITLIMFVSGCKYRSNVVLEEDGTVTESITITDTKAKNKLSKDEYSDYLDSEISKNIKLINYGDYSYKKINNEKVFGIKFYRSYDNICSYFQNTLFNQYVYKHIKCTETEEFVTIENDTPIKSTDNTEDYSDPVDLTDIELSIKLPFRAYENNADQIKDNNEYVWKLGSTVSKDKNIKFIISKNDLKEAYLRYEEQLRKERNLRIIKMCSLALGVFVVFVGTALVFYKKHEKNKLEY